MSPGHLDVEVEVPGDLADDDELLRRDLPARHPRDDGVGAVISSFATDVDTYYGTITGLNDTTKGKNTICPTDAPLSIAVSRKRPKALPVPVTSTKVPE